MQNPGPMADDDMMGMMWAIHDLILRENRDHIMPMT